MTKDDAPNEDRDSNAMLYSWANYTCQVQWQMIMEWWLGRGDLSNWRKTDPTSTVHWKYLESTLGLIWA